VLKIYIPSTCGVDTNLKRGTLSMAIERSPLTFCTLKYECGMRKGDVIIDEIFLRNKESESNV